MLLMISKKYSTVLRASVWSQSVASQRAPVGRACGILPFSPSTPLSFDGRRERGGTRATPLPHLYEPEPVLDWDSNLLYL